MWQRHLGGDLATSRERTRCQRSEMILLPEANFCFDFGTGNRVS
jgi:hypothetical protein